MHTCAYALQGRKAIIDLIQTDPFARDVTILDILNEPGGGNRTLGWSQAAPIYEHVAGYAYSVHPGAILHETWLDPNHTRVLPCTPRQVSWPFLGNLHCLLGFKHSKKERGVTL